MGFDQYEKNKCLGICLIIIAFFLPPLAVLLDRGCTCDLCINILLTLLGWLPGVVHAIYLIAIKEHEQSGNVFVQAPPSSQY